MCERNRQTRSNPEKVNDHREQKHVGQLFSEVKPLQTDYYLDECVEHWTEGIFILQHSVEPRAQGNRDGVVLWVCGRGGRYCLLLHSRWSLLPFAKRTTIGYFFPRPQVPTGGDFATHWAPPARRARGGTAHKRTQ